MSDDTLSPSALAVVTEVSSRLGYDLGDPAKAFLVGYLLGRESKHTNLGDLPKVKAWAEFTIGAFVDARKSVDRREARTS